MQTNFLNDVEFKNADDATFPPSDPNGIDLPFLLCAVGPPGTGKTYSMCQLLKRLVDSNDVIKLYIVSPTYHNNVGYFQDMDIKKEICEDMNQAIGFIEKMKNEMLQLKTLWKEIKKEYKTIQEFEEFFQFLIKNEEIKRLATMRIANWNGAYPNTLDEMAKRYMTQQKIPQKFNLLNYSEQIIKLVEQKGSIEAFYNRPPLACLFCDDIQGTRLTSNSKVSPFVNFMIKFRHYFTCVMFGVQYDSALPKSIRAIITDWLIFKVGDSKMIENLHREAANSEGEPSDFTNFFKDSIDGDTHRFLTINKRVKPLGARFNWDVVVPGGLQEMLSTHKSLKSSNNEEKQEETYV